MINASINNNLYLDSKNKSNLLVNNDLLDTFNNSQEKIDLISSKVTGFNINSLSFEEKKLLDYILYHVSYDKLDYILSFLNVDKSSFLNRKFVVFLQDVNLDLLKYFVDKNIISGYFNDILSIGAYDLLLSSNTENIKYFLSNLNLDLIKDFNIFFPYINKLNKDISDIFSFVLNKYQNLDYVMLYLSDIFSVFDGIPYNKFKDNILLLETYLGKLTINDLLQLRDILGIENNILLKYLLENFTDKRVVLTKSQVIYDILNYSSVENLEYVANIFNLKSLDELTYKAISYILKYGDIKKIDMNFNVFKKIKGFDDIVYKLYDNIWFARVLIYMDLEKFKKINISNPYDLFEPVVANKLITK